MSNATSGSVLIAPWGDPSGWREVNYKYEKHNETIKSITSLVPILCNEDVSRVVILVQDSVIFTQPKISINDIAMKCGANIIRECDNARNVVWKNVSEIGSYRDIVDMVSKYIRCIIQEAMVKAKDACPNKGLDDVDVEVIITPSIGTFNLNCGGTKQSVEFNGIFDLMYSVALLGLYNALSSANDVESVIFDATHGVNYFTMMSAMATQDMLSILSFRRAWGKKDMPMLTTYNAIPESPDNYLITKISTQLPSIRRLSSQDIGNLPTTIKVFYKALMHNAPLALYYLMNEKVDVGRYNDFVDRVKVSKQDGNALSVDYNLREQIEKDRDRTYLKLLFKEVMGSINEPNHCELLRLADSLYPMVSEASRTIITHELNNIYNKVANSLSSICGRDTSCRRKLSEILGTQAEAAEDVGRTGDRGIELRHLTAHAGLLKDYTMVNITVENAKIKELKFEYSDWNHIKSLLSD